MILFLRITRFGKFDLQLLSKKCHEKGESNTHKKDYERKYK